ncbi:MAG: hypothetical protein IE914_02785 [Thiotrichales bacterium]|nr:hypothetical protein [Thiotrichales bacterium]
MTTQSNNDTLMILSRIKSLSTAAAMIAGGYYPSNKLEAESISIDLAESAAMLAELLTNKLEQNKSLDARAKHDH